MEKLQKKRKLYSPILIDQNLLKSSFNIHQVKNAYFPYQPYPQQKQLISQVHQSILKGNNVLLQSPTGTGKTLCMLISAISGIMSLPQQKKFHKPKIFYLTRTHSQISQIIQQLKKTVYKCNINVMASRESMCLNKNLQALKGRNLDRACQQMCSQKLCKYKQDLSSEQKRHKKSQKVFKGMLTIDQLKEKGKAEFFCPYYASKQAIQSTHITILPYNYLLEWNMLDKHHLNLKNSILIFDEAHNIDSLAEEGSSFEMSCDILSNSVNQLNKLGIELKNRYLHKKFEFCDEDSKILCDLKYSLINLKNQLKSQAQNRSNKQQKVITNHNDIIQYIKNMTQFQNPENQSYFKGLDLNTYEDYLDNIKKIQKIFLQKKIVSQFFQYYASFINKVFMILDSDHYDDYFMIINTKQFASSIKFQCLNASHAFMRIQSQKPRSIILCSGTLSPLESWQTDLGIKFQSKLAIKSFIHKNQLKTFVLSQANTRQPYDFSFKMKNRAIQYENLSNELSKLQDIVPNGIVVAFSTYQLLQKAMLCCNKLKKKVFYESKTSNPELVYKKYSQQCRISGAFLFIIMKGRFAQGINFNDQLCRCLLIVGIPFLPMHDLKISKKKAYIESKVGREYAEQWYLNQTFRVVNQAIGRVIRSKQDYGCIILVDHRYQRNEVFDQLPAWFQSSLQENVTNKQVMCKIENYFKDKTWQNRIIVEMNNNIELKNEKVDDFQKQLDRTLIHKSATLQQLLDQQTPIKPQKKHKKLKVIKQYGVKNEKSDNSVINKMNKKRINNVQKQQNFLDMQIQEQNCTSQHIRSYFPWLSVDNYFLANLQLQKQSTSTLHQIHSQNQPQDSKHSTTIKQSNIEKLKIPNKSNFNPLF